MVKNSVGIAFDFEGPMVTLEEGHHKAHLETAKEVGLNLTLNKALKILPHFLGGPDEAVAQDIFNFAQKSSPEEIHNRKKELFEKWLKDLKVIPTRKGLIDFLKQLEKDKISYVIGTATAKDKFKYYLERTPFKNYFPDGKIIFGEDVKNNKPDPDVYLATAKLMGINPQNQIVFEDSPRGVKAAVAAGSHAFGLPVYHNKITNKILLDAGATKIFNEWGDVKIKDLILII